LGYGDVDTDLPTHQVGYGGNTQNRYITTYFRKSFNVVNPANYVSLALSLICDDGAVVYLNGTEIYRQGMPVGAITSSTLATASVGDPNERVWTNVNVSSAQLLAGNNVIAVEIHQVAVTSSDIAMNLLLKGNSTINVTRGPYLQMLGTNSVVVRWQTATATDSKVSYGLTTGYGSSATNATVSTEHEVSITGLAQDTKYFYQIGTTIVNIPSDAQTFFKTGLPTATTTDFSAWVTGDFGTGTSGQISVRDSYMNYANNPTPLARKADIWLWLGDNAYDEGTPNNYTVNVFNIYPDIMKNTTVFPAVGNHDYANFGDSPGGPHSFPYPDNHEYFSAFTMPNNQLGGVASNTKRYYSYNYGNVHFIVLDSYGVVTNSSVIDATNNPMFTWLKSDLMANTQKWIVCYFHHPPYSKGTHNSDTEAGLANMRQYYVPLLETYHVDLVLSGHSHVYERSFLIKDHTGIASTFSSVNQVNNTLGNVAPYYVKSLVNGQGTVYAVCGNSGQGGAPSGTGHHHNAMAVTDTLHWGSMILNFRPNEIEAKYLQTNGISSTYTEYDSFKIVKNPCVAGVTVEESITSGDWHTTSTWGCGTIPTTDSMVKINTGHTVTLNTANTADIKRIYVFGMLRYLSNKQLRLKN
jgi:acid phosphatase type 7